MSLYLLSERDAPNSSLRSCTKVEIPRGAMRRSSAHDARARLFCACYNFMFDAAPESRPWCRASLHVRGPLAQLAEQQTLNLRVLGSIPRRLTTLRSRL